MGRPVSFEERFWSKVDVRGPHECWHWTACRARYGYGMIRHDGRTQRAHRVALLLTDAPPRGHALHHCDAPSCCNPLHLYWGTDADNVADRERRGRSGSAKGDRNGSRKYPGRRPRGVSHGDAIRRATPRGDRVATAKLNDNIVALVLRDDRPHAHLARELGVTPRTIRLIRLGQTWKHVARLGVQS